MTPYSSLYFFVIMGVLLLPVAVLGLRGKRNNYYNMAVTVVLLVLIFSDDFQHLYAFIGYLVWQILLFQVYFRYRKVKNQAFIFTIFMLLALLPLLLDKILPFFHSNSLIGFLGISYITFKSLQMIMDTRDGTIKELSIKDQIAFLVFFPTISSGPIDRYKRFTKDCKNVPPKEEYKELLHDGIHQVFIGLLYKFIIGHLIFTHVISTPYIQYKHLRTDFIYMYAYSLYLFFDFAGYSAFAIGISKIMGVKTPENFNLPFISRNIKDFWNRWHMTLSFWFRDYVYMRFVMWMTKKKWIKNRYTISYLGFTLLFLLMGIWHGLELHYIVYGLYHAFLIISFDLFERKNKKYRFWKKNKFTHAMAVIITFNAVCFGLLIFSGRLFI